MVNREDPPLSYLMTLIRVRTTSGGDLGVILPRGWNVHKTRIVLGRLYLSTILNPKDYPKTIWIQHSPKSLCESERVALLLRLCHLASKHWVWSTVLSSIIYLLWHYKLGINDAFQPVYSKTRESSSLLCTLNRSIFLSMYTDRNIALYLQWVTILGHCELRLGRFYEYLSFNYCPLFAAATKNIAEYALAGTGGLLILIFIFFVTGLCLCYKCKR